MKPISIILSLFSLICFCVSGYGQIQPMGFTQKVITPNISLHEYTPKMQLINDTLFIATNTGVYMKNMKYNSDWQLYAFKDAPVIDFIRNGNQILASSMGTWNGIDSLLLLSEDNGRTFIDFTSSHFTEYGKNHLLGLAQNPLNPNSVLINAFRTGLSYSGNFGKDWKNLSPYSLGFNLAFVGYHPLDTTVIFYSGEKPSLSGHILSSYDSGKTWNDYTVPNRDNCVHHIAFHPTNPDILIFGGEGVVGRSTDKGNNWEIVYKTEQETYIKKIVFDENDPEILYMTGSAHYGSELNEKIRVYRSTDMGEIWHLAYNEDVGADYRDMVDMIKYKNKLIFYTRDCGLFELDLETTPPLSVQTITVPVLTVFPNPVHKTLYFDTDTGILNIEIVDMAGRSLQNTAIVSGEKAIDVSGLCSGIYFAVFQTDNQKITKKICIDN
ncbi:MAG: T9SS type A sorting domain-containing protein [Dysgonomonas sp.]